MQHDDLLEGWSIPFAVILVVPLGVLGVVAATLLRSYANDIYFQVGLITIIGLSAKNTILIIEFAKDLQAHGKSAVDAALEAAHLRFRPIVMTSTAVALGACFQGRRAAGPLTPAPCPAGAWPWRLLARPTPPAGRVPHRAACWPW